MAIPYKVIAALIYFNYVWIKLSLCGLIAVERMIFHQKSFVKLNALSHSAYDFLIEMLFQPNIGFSDFKQLTQCFYIGFIRLGQIVYYPVYKMPGCITDIKHGIGFKQFFDKVQRYEFGCGESYILYAKFVCYIIRTLASFFFHDEKAAGRYKVNVSFYGFFAHINPHHIKIFMKLIYCIAFFTIR
ncbi:hypothetical protein SDC9_163634 [bioreactor metagenome]|uniref:Uncharacterized protein n=1 Tax=bioreactor metagenome TaxID=1076179 RepID=A0A645FRE8_9ZZZZ